MSNLSELLPSGGGQNAVDFVASGTLSSGQTVALNSDGTVSAVALGGPAAGSTSIFNNGVSSYFAAVYDSDNDRIVVAYRDNADSDDGKGVVGTISGNTIAFGEESTFTTGVINYVALAYDALQGRVIVFYQNTSNSSYGECSVATISGNSISWGTASVYNSAGTAEQSAAYDSNASKVVVAFNDQNASGKARVVSIIGTSVSYGTTATFVSSRIADNDICFDSTSNKLVIAYSDQGAGYIGKCVLGTISGTSISFTSPVNFFGGNTGSGVSCAYDSNADKTVITAGDGGTTYVTAVVGTISGGAITFGSLVPINDFAGGNTKTAYDSVNNKIVVLYKSNVTPSTLYSIVGTVSGTSISFGDPVLLESVQSYYDIAYSSVSNASAIVYGTAGADIGTSVVFQTETSNAPDFIGITAGAISDTATGSVNTYGSINSRQSGLTIGADYYVQNDGSLSTTASDVKVGQAISATTINMMDLT